MITKTILNKFIDKAQRYLDDATKREDVTDMAYYEGEKAGYTNVKVLVKQKIFSETIYVLTLGEYKNKNNELVTSDVREIAKIYVEKITDPDYISTTDAPEVQIWFKGEVIDYFSEHVKDEKKLIKILSKKAMRIE